MDSKKNVNLDDEFLDFEDEDIVEQSEDLEGSLDADEFLDILEEPTEDAEETTEQVVEETSESELVEDEELLLADDDIVEEVPDGAEEPVETPVEDSGFDEAADEGLDIEVTLDIFDKLLNSQEGESADPEAELKAAVENGLRSGDLVQTSADVVEKVKLLTKRKSGFVPSLTNIQKLTQKFTISEKAFRSGGKVVTNELGMPIRGGFKASNLKEGNLLVIYPPALSTPTQLGEDTFLPENLRDCINESLVASKGRIVESKEKPIFAFVGAVKGKSIDIVFFNGLSTALQKGQEVDSKYLALLFNNTKIQIVRNVPLDLFKVSTGHTFKNGKISDDVSKVLFKRQKDVKVRGLILLDRSKFNELSSYNRKQ